MNALNVTALKVFACGVVAVAVTLGGSYAFVTSTAVVRTVVAPTQMVASASISHLAQSATAALLK